MSRCPMTEAGVQDEIILLAHSQIERHSDRDHPFGECLCSGCDTNKRILALLGVQVPGRNAVGGAHE